LSQDVVIEGVGVAGFATATPNLSWKELMYQAASRAYEDAGGLNPRKDVDGFITCAEDYWEGFGIFDEFTPDQLGGVLRPNFTVTGDGLHGLAQAFMLVKTGLMDRVVVEAHSKASDMATYNDILLHAFDPIFHKPLGGHPHYLAGLEMSQYLAATGTTAAQCARVVAKNKRNAKRNPLASYDATATVEDVLASEPLFDPLKRLDVAPLADASVVFVVTNRGAARGEEARHVRLAGVGWNQDSPFPESRDPAVAHGARLAAEQAYRIARVEAPRRQIQVAEVDDQFSFKELQHLEALGLADTGSAGKLVEEGRFDPDGALPVNVSGGSLGVGNLLEAKGAARAYEVVLQLRGEAGPRQVKGASVGLAHAWRGLPTASHAVAVLSTNGVGR
jgi:acetyl-CoA C-acetyltransferase